MFDNCLTGTDDKGTKGDNKSDTKPKLKLKRFIKFFDSNVMNFPSDEIFSYDYRKFRPFGALEQSRCSRNELNTFTGWKASHERGAELWNTSKNEYKTKVERINHHFRDVLCHDEDPELKQKKFDYLLDWIYHVITKPWSKTQKVLWFYAPDGGEGKSMLFEEFLPRILGSVFHKINKDDFSAKSNPFSAVPEQAIILLVDDNENCDILNGMKNLITSSTMQVHRKYENPYETESYVNFIICANYEPNVHSKDGKLLTPVIGRVQVFHVSNRYLNNKDYFIGLFDLIKNDPDLPDMYLHWILNRKPSCDNIISRETIGSLKVIENSSLKDELKNSSSLDYILEFLDNYEGENWNLSAKMSIKTFIKKIFERTKSKPNEQPNPNSDPQFDQSIFVSQKDLSQLQEFLKNECLNNNPRISQYGLKIQKSGRNIYVTYDRSTAKPIQDTVGDKKPNKPYYM